MMLVDSEGRRYLTSWDAYTDARLSDYRRDWDFYAGF